MNENQDATSLAFRRNRVPSREPTAVTASAAPTAALLATARPTLRQVLKQHTAPLHRQLDALPSLAALLKPALNLPDYHRILTVYVRAYEPLEAILTPLEKTLRRGNMSPYTPRLPALIQDLSRLSQWVPAAHVAPGANQKPGQAHTEWHYWGMRYVLEGATQGSKFIAVQVGKNLPQLVPCAFAFWDLQLQLAQGWPLFCEYLNQPSPHIEAEQQLLEGATHAFLTFIECFSS